MTILERREQKGLEQGRYEGRHQEKIKIVKTLIEKKYDAKTILEIVDISREEIEDIRKEMLK